MKGISELTARLLKPHDIQVAHYPSATLKQQLTHLKPQIDPLQKKNVIYTIKCNDCVKKYVGQTGRKLATRIHEHELAIKRHDPLSLISVHEDQEGHKFDLSRVNIVDQARTRHAREFLEALHSDANAINKKIDLDTSYYPILMNRQPNERRQRDPRALAHT